RGSGTFSSKLNSGVNAATATSESVAAPGVRDLRFWESGFLSAPTVFSEPVAFRTHISCRRSVEQPCLGDDRTAQRGDAVVRQSHYFRAAGGRLRSARGRRSVTCLPADGLGRRPLPLLCASQCGGLHGQF